MNGLNSVSWKIFASKRIYPASYYLWKKFIDNSTCDFAKIFGIFKDRCATHTSCAWILITILLVTFHDFESDVYSRQNIVREKLTKKNQIRMIAVRCLLGCSFEMKTLIREKIKTGM